MPDTAADPADYGPADDIGADPATAVCRACGCIAADHKHGRYSIYGVCPPPTTAARVLADCLRTGSDPFTTDDDAAEAAGEAMAEALRRAGFDV